MTLTDIYTAGGEVLMGTLRWEKERDEHLASDERAAAVNRERLKLEVEEAKLAARATVLQRQLELKHAELADLKEFDALAVSETARALVDIQEKRGADDPDRAPGVDDRE